MSLQPYQLPHIITYSQLLTDSYKRWTGWDLVSGRNIGYGLFMAPFAVLSHGIETDPLLHYGNQAALDLWETEWNQFIGMPSRLSAEPEDDIQSNRNELLRTAMEKGWTMNYNGTRISSTGRRFEIINTVVWNVTDASGHIHGQAARIGTWRYL